MSITFIIIFFILGCLMGSFYTVIGKRLPKKENFFFGHSYCDKCRHNLSLIEMIPLLSFIFLKGKCRYCGEKIESLSTYMEIFTGILFALSYYIFNFSFSLYIALGIVSILIIISVTDTLYFIIPDEVLIFFSGYFLIIITLSNGMFSALTSILSATLLFIIMYLIMLLGNFLLKKESLGGGDIKLMFVIGLLINPLLGIFSIFLASIIALPVSFYLLYSKNQKLIPYGPFLLISLMLIYFTRIDINMIIKFLLLK